MNTPLTETNYYTTAEVAKRYRVATKTVRNWIHRKSIGFIKIGGASGGRCIVRFRDEDLITFDRNNRRPAHGSA